MLCVSITSIYRMNQKLPASSGRKADTPVQISVLCRETFPSDAPASSARRYVCQLTTVSPGNCRPTFGMHVYRVFTVLFRASCLHKRDREREREFGT